MSESTSLIRFLVDETEKLWAIVCDPEKGKKKNYVRLVIGGGSNSLAKDV